MRTEWCNMQSTCLAHDNKYSINTNNNNKYNETLFRGYYVHSIHSFLQLLFVNNNSVIIYWCFPCTINCAKHLRYKDHKRLSLLPKAYFWRRKINLMISIIYAKSFNRVTELLMGCMKAGALNMRRHVSWSHTCIAKNLLCLPLV